MVDKLSDVPRRDQLDLMTDGDRKLARMIEKLFYWVSEYVSPTYWATLGTPATIIETSLEVDVLTLTTPEIRQGLYNVSVSFTAKYNATGDQIQWGVSGDVTSDTYLSQSSNDIEVVPFSYVDTVNISQGVTTVTLWCRIYGAGVSQVTISQANIQLIRRGDS